MPHSNGDDQPKAVVEITLADVYATLVDVRDKVNTLATQRENDDETLKDHSKRLTALEKRVWALPSFAVILSAVSIFVAVAGR